MKISLPEQVWIDYEPATFASRFLAYTNDFAIRWGVVALVIFALLISAAYFGIDSPWKAIQTAIDAHEHQDLLIALFVVFFFVVEWSYPVFFEVVRGGVTPGKAILGLQVVDERGLPLTFRTSFLRTTFLLIDSLPGIGLVGFLCMMFTKNNQRLGDLVARTMVVHQATAHTQDPTKDQAGSEQRILIPLDLYSVLEKFLARMTSLAPDARSKTANRLVEKLRPELPDDYPSPPNEQKAKEAWLSELLSKSAPRRNTPERRSADPFMNWKQVSDQLDQAEKMLNSFKEVSKRELRSQERLTSAAEEFQRLCQLYSYLSTFYPSTNQATRAAQLVRKGRTLFYGRRLRSLEEKQTAFLKRASVAFSEIRLHTAFVTAISFLAAGIAAAFVFINPSLIYSLLPEPVLSNLEHGHLWTEDARGWAASTSAEIMINNIKVSLMCFASGISAGVLTIVLAIHNGANVGALFAATSFFRMNHALLEFILAHGFLEISVIMVSCGCGLFIGDGLLRPGTLTRLRSLQRRTAVVVPLVLFNAASLVVAGYIEGHVSPYEHFSLGSKLLIGLFLGAVYWTLLFLPSKGKAAKDRRW